jgi:predicted nucleic acid-binding Zn ribbon protein
MINNRKAKAIPIKDVMHQLLNQFKKVAEKNFEQKAIKSWGEVMGENIVKYTQELKISNGTLYVTLSSPELRQELGYVKEKIAKSLNNSAGKDVIKKIVFK